MKRSLLVLLLSLSFTVCAQDYPQWEIFTGVRLTNMSEGVRQELGRAWSIDFCGGVTNCEVQSDDVDLDSKARNTVVTNLGTCFFSIAPSEKFDGLQVAGGQIREDFQASELGQALVGFNTATNSFFTTNNVKWFDSATNYVPTNAQVFFIRFETTNALWQAITRED